MTARLPAAIDFGDEIPESAWAARQGLSYRLSAQEALALPCYNNPGPYVDIEKNNVREWAASQCFKRCTQLEWCEQQRQETVRDHGSAVGVWAGHVWTHSDYRSDGVPTAPRGSDATRGTRHRTDSDRAA